MRPPRLRFAPSPTGPLHLGSAVVAVANALAARGLGGELLLRIDDTDAERTVEGAEQGILDDLAWLGLELTGAPVRQSERAALHVAAAARLLATAHAYRCFCPPSQERYDGRCRALPRADAERRHEAGEANVVRFRVPVGRGRRARTPRAAPCASPATRSPTSCSCARDGRPTFDLATSVDDRDLGITHIVRGEDHLANSARHLLLLRALGAVEPVFAHCPIIVGADGERLSTRRGAEPLAALRARGVPPEAVVAFAAQLACPAQGGATRGRVRSPSSPRASRSRGSGAARRMPIPRTSPGSVARCWPASPPASSTPAARAVPAAPGTPQPVLEALAEAARGAPALGEVADSAMALAQRPAEPVRPSRRRSRSSASCARPTRASSCRTRTAVELVDRLRALGTTRGLSARDVLHPLRIALTGAPHGLPLPVVVAVLPREEALERCRT